MGNLFSKSFRGGISCWRTMCFRLQRPHRARGELGEQQERLQQQHVCRIRGGQIVNFAEQEQQRTWRRDVQRKPRSVFVWMECHTAHRSFVRIHWTSFIHKQFCWKQETEKRQKLSGFHSFAPTTVLVLASLSLTACRQRAGGT